MKLSEFLLARIAEEENDADYGAHAFDCNTFEVKRMQTIPGASYSLECTCGETRQRLAECKAKRQIIDLGDDGTFSEYPTGSIAWVLKELAQVYADHPDYREEWRP